MSTTERPVVLPWRIARAAYAFQSFCPEDATLMKEAFESAWTALKACGNVDTASYRAEWAREILALRIIDQVHNGIRDLAKLREDAIAHLPQCKFVKDCAVNCSNAGTPSHPVH
jgi:hypothetical protein